MTDLIKPAITFAILVYVLVMIIFFRKTRSPEEREEVSFAHWAIVTGVVAIFVTWFYLPNFGGGSIANNIKNIKANV